MRLPGEVVADPRDVRRLGGGAASSGSWVPKAERLALMALRRTRPGPCDDEMMRLVLTYKAKAVWKKIDGKKRCRTSS